VISTLSHFNPETFSLHRVHLANILSATLEE
jgi:hypothetical protein